VVAIAVAVVVAAVNPGVILIVRFGLVGATVVAAMVVVAAAARAGYRPPIGRA
jgi:hypothetical protein